MSTRCALPAHWGHSMPNGNGGGNGGGGFDFGGLFDALLNGLAQVIAAIIAFLQELVAVLVQVLNFLFVGEQEIFGFSLKGLGEVFKSMKTLLDRIWKSVIVAALKKLYALYQTIQKWAKKLKAWLDRWHALTRKYQIAAMRRIINLIQRVRQILVIFRVFHLKFAQKLDGWLSAIESRLIHREANIIAKTNEIIGWVNFIADPTKLFRMSPLAQSIYRYLRGLRGALGIPESRALTADEQTRQDQDRALLKNTPQLSDPAVQRILSSLDDAAKYYAP